MPLRTQSGFTLMELMIAMAIGLFLLTGMAAVFVNSNQTYADLSHATQQIENGRFATTTVADDVALAGHYGRYSAQLATPGSLPDPCEIANMANLRTAMALPIQGYDAAGSTPVSCIDSANFVPGTDVLVIRRADSQTTAAASLVANQVYMQANADPTNSANPIVALGTAANFPLLDKDDTTISPIRKYHVHIYFVAPCSIPNGGGTTCTGSSDDGGSPIPTLKRLELTLDSSGNLGMQLVSLVEGIEDFQVDYGIDTDQDGAPDAAYVTAPALADWQNVVAVRLNIRARNLEATSGFVDTTTYDMGAGGTATPGGAYKRHVYNAVVRIVNPSGRRAS